MKIKISKILLILFTSLILICLILLFLTPSETLRKTLSTLALISTSLGILSAMYYWGSTTRTLDEITDHAERIAQEDFSGVLSHGTREAGGAGAQLSEVIEKLEEKLRVLGTERDHYHAILQGMMEGVLVTDPQGKILQANPSFYRMLALDSRCEGKTVLECLRNHEIHEALNKTLTLQSPQEREVSIRLKEQEKHFLIHTTPLTGPLGLQEAILVFFDTTRIRELENARKEFVANVSHELKTPLTSIRGYAETLKHGALQDPPMAKRFLEKIENNAGQLQNLIEDLLNLSEIESGRFELKLSEVPLSKVFQEMEQEFSEALAKKNLRMEIHLAAELKVLAEPSALRQILTNLISNAVKYTPSGGRLSLSAESADHLAKITVRDTGMGIPARDLPHIFERFYRVDKARSREMGGTGLGLAIVKHLVQTLGGEVGVQSQEGQGSQFFFTLPYPSTSPKGPS